MDKNIPGREATYTMGLMIADSRLRKKDKKGFYGTPFPPVRNSLDAES